MATTLTMLIDQTQLRNVREELRTRLEGCISQLDSPLVIRNGVDRVAVELPSELPVEELKACVAAIASLVRRPESGIIGNVTVSPELTVSVRRNYST